MTVHSERGMTVFIGLERQLYEEDNRPECRRRSVMVWEQVVVLYVTPQVTGKVSVQQGIKGVREQNVLNTLSTEWHIWSSNLSHVVVKTL